MVVLRAREVKPARAPEVRIRPVQVDLEHTAGDV